MSGTNIVNVFIASGVASICGFVAGGNTKNWLKNQEAIKAEVAEYRVNPKTGSVKFEWLPKEVRTLTNIVYVTNTIYQLKMAESNHYSPKPWVTNHVIKKK